MAVNKYLNNFAIKASRTWASFNLILPLLIDFMGLKSINRGSFLWIN